MSKNIKVQRDGVTETFSGVKEIQTINVDGRVTWVPLDSVVDAVKTINKNGTYKAKSDGFYGYSKVVVDVGGKTVGVKRDGKTYAVDTDEDGWITERLLPDSIRIKTPPTKDSYQSGEGISLAGAVIKAYSGSDLWDDEDYPSGIVPIEELAAEPLYATGSGIVNVTIIWSRPEDGEDLTATYEIAVIGE